MGLFLLVLFLKLKLKVTEKKMAGFFLEFHFQILS